MPYRYLRDPLFVICFLVYGLHRWLAACDLSTPLLRGYLNDLICIPFWVPIMVWIIRKLGLREHDAPPNSIEVVTPLLIICVLFEVVIPAQRAWPVPTIADPYDILAYCVGALAAVVFWKWHYRQRQSLLLPDKLETL